jgi:predicted phosphodiesterase
MKLIPFSQTRLQPNKIRIAFFSDTHLNHNKVQIPPCHILVHCGDIAFRSSLVPESEAVQAYKNFNSWIQNAAPNAHKIVIAGNHDAYLQKIGPIKAQELLFNCIYLENSSCTLHGIHFFGSPVSQETSRRSIAFQTPADITEFHNKLPLKVDVLVTHSNNIINDQKIKQLGTKIHAWGHFHNLFGVQKQTQNFISLCACMVKNKKPIVIDYDS